jgi:hypothetical protein
MGDSRSNCWIGGAGFTVGLEYVCFRLGEHSATLHTFSSLGSTLCMDDWRISKRAFREKKKSKLIELGMLRLAIAYSSRKKPSLAHFRETESASHQERESDDGIVRFHIAAVSVPLSSRRLNGGAGARSFNKAQK